MIKLTNCKCARLHVKNMPLPLLPRGFARNLIDRCYAGNSPHVPRTSRSFSSNGNVWENSILQCNTMSCHLKFLYTKNTGRGSLTLNRRVIKITLEIYGLSLRILNFAGGHVALLSD